MPGPNSDPSEPLIDQYWDDKTVWLGASDGWSGSRRFHPDELLEQVSEISLGSVQIQPSEFPVIEGYDSTNDPFLTEI